MYSFFKAGHRDGTRSWTCTPYNLSKPIKPFCKTYQEVSRWHVLSKPIKKYLQFCSILFCLSDVTEFVVCKSKRPFWLMRTFPVKRVNICTKEHEKNSWGPLWLWKSGSEERFCVSAYASLIHIALLLADLSILLPAVWRRANKLFGSMLFSLP